MFCVRYISHKNNLKNSKAPPNNPTKKTPAKLKKTNQWKDIYSNLKLEGSVYNCEHGKNSENIREKVHSKRLYILKHIIKKKKKVDEEYLLSFSKLTYGL